MRKQIIARSSSRMRAHDRFHLYLPSQSCPVRKMSQVPGRTTLGGTDHSLTTTDRRIDCRR